MGSYPGVSTTINVTFGGSFETTWEAPLPWWARHIGVAIVLQGKVKFQVLHHMTSLWAYPYVLHASFKKITRVHKETYQQVSSGFFE